MKARFAADVTPIQELYSHLYGYCGEYKSLEVCMKRVRELVEELLPNSGPIAPAKRGVELKEKK